MMISRSSHLNILLDAFRPTLNQIDQFRMWHVETLLNQAADLLDRCLAERLQYDALLEKEALFNIETKNLQDTQTLQLERKMTPGAMTAALDALTEIQDAKGLLTKYAVKNNDFLDVYTMAYNSIIDAQHANPNDQPLNRSQYFRDQASLYAYEAQACLLAADVKSLNAQVTGEKSNEAIQKTANKQLDAQIALREEQSKDDNALDYRSRLSPIKNRITADFEDAVARIGVAFNGLNAIYNYSQQPGTRPPPSGSQDIDKLWAIDAYTLWVRDAIRWLIAFGQLDQNWTAIVSLVEIMGIEAFNKSKMENKNRASFEFAIAKSVFASHTFVRLRGISINLRGKPSELLFKGTVTLPTKAISSFGGEANPILQGDLPKCVIGRIEKRSAVRSPEIAGIVSLMNASPIGAENDAAGKWTIDIESISSAGGAISDIDDIELELTLLGRPSF